jgi:hypothetical protein
MFKSQKHYTCVLYLYFDDNIIDDNNHYSACSVRPTFNQMGTHATKAADEE